MPENQNEEDQVEIEIIHIQIWDKLCDLEPIIQDNRNRIDDLEKRVVPDDWEEILRDVAAVGRTGRLIRRIVIWGTPIAGALIAVWQYISMKPPTGG